MLLSEAEAVRDFLSLSTFRPVLATLYALYNVANAQYHWYWQACSRIINLSDFAGPMHLINCYNLASTRSHERWPARSHVTTY